MIENTDFVNMYIDKLNKAIHDLTGRNIVLETRLDVIQKHAAQQEEQIAGLKAELEQQDANHQRELVARAKQIDHIKQDNNQLKAKLKLLEEVEPDAEAQDDELVVEEKLSVEEELPVEDTDETF